jgi:hypothetical protein
MRRFTPLILFVVFAFLRGASFAAPMEFRELRLLVQGRVPETEIMSDLQKRKLAKALNEDEMAELSAAGASRSLLAAVARPEVSISAQEASKYLADKERNAQRAKLFSLPRVWILGEIKQSGETGDTFVICSNLCRSQIPADKTKPDELVHFSQRPPAFSLSKAGAIPVDHIGGGKGPFFVNCMAAIVGLHEHAMQDEKVQTVQEVALVESLAPTAQPYGNVAPPTQGAAAQPAVAKRPPITKRATLPTGQWLPLAKYGGPNVQMDIHNIQMTFLQVQIEKIGPVNQFKIETSGRTLIYDDGHGCRTFYVYDISCPSGSGVFEFEHTPDSASYPKGG